MLPPTVRPRAAAAIGIVLVSSLFIATLSCGEGGTEPTTMTVSPASATLTALGDSVRFTAQVLDQYGGAMASGAVSWSSSDVAVATVNTSGVATAVGDGTATIIATSGAASGTADVTVIGQSEEDALIAFFRSTGGPQWINNANWLTDAPLGDWYGVSADRYGRVVVLDLRDNNLVGPIPHQIGDLTDLARLYLHGNVLVGEIPPELGNLTRLVELNLGANTLAGSIPPEIGRLSNLEGLRISSNALSGGIPPGLGSLGSLRWLDFSNNDLSGELPEELGDLTSLSSLSLHFNSLTGPIPSSFLQLDLLRFSFTDRNRARNAHLCLPGTTAFVAWAERAAVSLPQYCNEVDVTALESLYEATGGADWRNSGGWLASPALNEWYGVESDSLGRVVSLDLTNNELSGELPAELGHLSEMTGLRIGNNPLTGRLPLSLTAVSLRVFDYTDTELCTPTEASFGDWLGDITVHDGTGVECAALTDRDILATLYRATGGLNWQRRDNWLTDAPLGDWYGVDVRDDGRVTSLVLWSNNLVGAIPAELGGLEHLLNLTLTGNRVAGPIPGELGNLSNLQRLWLDRNLLEGAIPSELGNLSLLRDLSLAYNHWGGSIPPELGNLTNLTTFMLNGNHLTGPIPPEFGRMRALKYLWLSHGQLSGSIPPELGELSQLEVFSVRDNRLTGSIPAGLGGLSRLRSLYLQDNDLTGPFPREFGNLLALQALYVVNNDLTGSLPWTFGNLRDLEILELSNNARLSGPLPGSLQGLDALDQLMAGGTALCAPDDSGFLQWLEKVANRRVRRCPTEERSKAYLIQAAQSLEFPVTLVATERAMLRVFVTVPEATDVTIPPVRAAFYHDGSQVHVVDIQRGSVPIPTVIDESNLANSANAEIPGWVVQPGLEMVIEIDPDSTVDAELGLQRRIPVSGRKPVDVREMPAMHLTVIPLLWTQAPDSSILEITDALAADDTLLWKIDNFLPIADLEVAVHEPVWTSHNGASALPEVEAIRVMEGGSGYYMGTMAGTTDARSGAAYTPGFSSFAIPSDRTMAHELAHNMFLYHAPCGGPGGVDATFPSPNASIGVWGYDFRSGTLVPASYKDLMSYCRPDWISDYNFGRLVFYRLRQETAATVAGPVQSMLLWGGLDEGGHPFLEPAFVVDAPPVPPTASGEYSLSGRTGTGEELFVLSFDMREVSDGGSPSFTFALPVRADWAGRLTSITLAGPEGSVSLDGDSDRAMTILRDPRTGQVRGILRETSPEGVARIARTLGRGLEVLFSRGMPDGAAWRR